MILRFLVLPQENGALLRNFLRAHEVSASLMRSVKTHGGLFCDGVPIHTDQRLGAGSEVSFALPPERDTTVTSQALPLDIVYEDAHAMVLNKPAGMTVHPTLGYLDGTLANAFCGEMARRGMPCAFRPVNRLDRNTSGLVLCALNEYAAPILARTAEKRYYAIAEGQMPDAGCIDAPIGLCEGSFVKHCVTASGKPSTTRFETLYRGEGLSFVRLLLLTGRTHQIRVHLTYLGHPLAGDDFYGGAQTRIARQALHCGSMAFLTPQTGERRTVLQPLPPDMRALLPKGFSCGDSLFQNAPQEGEKQEKNI